MANVECGIAARVELYSNGWMDMDICTILQSIAFEYSNWNLYFPQKIELKNNMKLGKMWMFLQEKMNHTGMMEF